MINSVFLKLIFSGLLLSVTGILSGQSLTTPDSAKYFEGKTMVVCGKVFGTFVSKSGMTFLNFGNPYPDHTFAAVIAKKDSAVLQGVSPSFYKGRNVCVKGRIKIYKDKPELFIESPAHLWVDEQ